MKDFAKEIAEAVEKYKIGYDDVVNHSLLELSRSVVMMTPRDTGRARNNWTADINKIPTGTKDNSASPSAILNRVENKTKKASRNIFYLVNNLPYIGKLEFGRYPSPSKSGLTQGGYSKDAAQGMVRVSMENYPQYLKNAIENLT